MSVKDTTTRPIWVKVLAYGAPSVGMALLLGPVAQVLSGIYAKHYDVSLTDIATVMLIARLFDAVTDPLIGYFSDRLRTKISTRKPFIVVGSLLLVPCSYFLFSPLTDDVGMGYFTFWYMAFYFSYTLIQIPYLALANEFTYESKDKTLVFSISYIMGMAGGALFYLIPMLPFFSNTEITPQVLQLTVMVGAVVLLFGVFLMVKIVPNGAAPLTRSSQSPIDQGVSHNALEQVRAISKSLLANKPFVLYVSAFMCSGIGVGMWAGMFFIYVDTYLKLGDVFAQISLWSIFLSAAAIPVWYRFATWAGKRLSWLLAMSLFGLAFLYTSLLSPNGTGFYELFLLNMMIAFASVSMGVIAPSILCDVIDYGRFTGDAECNAIYFSILSLLTKMQIAIGGALGIALVGWFGFDVHAQTQSSMALIGLHIGMSWVPATLVGLAMFFIVLMPLNERRMTVIRARLAARSERAGRLV